VILRNLKVSVLKGFRFDLNLNVPAVNLKYLVLLTLVGLSLSSQARVDCVESVGQFVDLQCRIETPAPDGEEWQKADLDTALCEGSTIRVGVQSGAAINLVNEAVLRLDENTTLRLVDITEEEEKTSLTGISVPANHPNYYIDIPYMGDVSPVQPC
jgi:hypothetical protein